jgi:hypothetical protein
VLFREIQLLPHALEWLGLHVSQQLAGAERTALAHSVNVRIRPSVITRMMGGRERQKKREREREVVKRERGRERRLSEEKNVTANYYWLDGKLWMHDFVYVM